MGLMIVPEIWATVEHSGRQYQVSTDGKVKLVSSRKTRPSFGTSMANGYMRMSVRGSPTPYVHQLVAKAFIPNPENKKQVNHKNSNRLDNRVVNLEWLTHQENIIHARKAGRMSKPPTKKPVPIVAVPVSGSIGYYFPNRNAVASIGMKSNTVKYAAKQKTKHGGYWWFNAVDAQG